MDAEINASMNIESMVFKLYKQYLKDKSKFSPNVFNRTPKNLSVFPTIVLKESNNTEDSSYTTLNRKEFVNTITDVIEIYTKDLIIDGVKYPSKEVMNELKYLTFDFFQAWGFTRTQCSEADYLNLEVDRLVIIETCKLNNWNRKIF